MSEISDQRHELEIERKLLEDKRKKINAKFQVVGTIAALISFGTYMPALYSAIRNPEILSDTTFYVIYGMNWFANFVWLAYGIGIKATAVVISAVVTIIVASTILILTIIYTHNKNKNSTASISSELK